MAGGTQALAILQAYVDADGALVVSASSSSTGIVLSIAGTANQVLANGGIVPVGGAVTLSIPSDFRVAASGVFGSLTFAPMGELTALSTSTSLPRGISNFQINNSTDSANFSAYKSRGVPGTETTIVTGDILANFRGWGYDGANYLNMASIRYVSTGTIAATRVPTQIEFYTATDAAPSVLTLALTLNKTQGAVFANSITVPTSVLTPAISIGGATLTIQTTSANVIQFSVNTTPYMQVNTVGNIVGLNGATFISNSATFLARSSATLNNGAAAQVATMTNGPTAGNPTKWIPVDDNGTTRYVPSW